MFAAILRNLQALQIRPEYDASWNNLGNVLDEIGELEAAARAYRQASFFSISKGASASPLIISPIASTSLAIGGRWCALMPNR